MAGRGPAPEPHRIRGNGPARGEWTPSPDGGWQHPLRPPPPGLIASSVAVWDTWFKSWWAGNYGPDDLPGLHLLIRVWDRVHRGDLKRIGELRQLMDSYGITPKGQQDRRWVRPVHKAPSYSERQRDAADTRSIKERLRDIEAKARQPAGSRFEQLIGPPSSHRDPRLDPVE